MALSDMHDQFGRFFPGDMPEADVCLIGGDFTNWGMRKPEEVDRARRWLGRMTNRYAEIAYVLGNHDIGIARRAFEQHRSPFLDGDVSELDSDIREICGVTMVGINLSTCFAAPELKAQWTNMTDDPAVDAAAFESLPRAQVVVSHSPPVGWLDNAGYVLSGSSKGFAHIGSPGLLAYIERCKPALVICGHVHEAAGFAQYDHEDGSVTDIYNVARTWRLIEFDETRVSGA